MSTAFVSMRCTTRRLPGRHSTAETSTCVSKPHADRPLINVENSWRMCRRR
jgi:hypothetical protein